MVSDCSHSLDAIVRARLTQWPQRPPGLDGDCNRAWLRGRPDITTSGLCFLKLPGSERLRTMPDGLWLNFGGTPEEPFADIFAIEACASLPNFLDKRSRFAPSTQSLMAVCPMAWLLAPASPNSKVPRWKATGVVRDTPTAALILPVRDLRVMYGLRERHYAGFLQHQVPHPHEFFVPMEALTAKDGDRDPAMQELVARTSMKANFMTKRAAA